MRMNNSELFDAFAEDYSSPAPEDVGSKIAEAMEAKLSALMDKYEKKLEELTAANANNPDDSAALQKIAETLPADPNEGGGEGDGEGGGEDA